VRADDPASQTPGIRYVQLDYLTEFETGYTLTVGDRVGGEKRGVKLTPAYYKMQGRPFDSFLLEEALVLIRDFTKSRALTFEPSAQRCAHRIFGCHLRIRRLHVRRRVPLHWPCEHGPVRIRHGHAHPLVQARGHACRKGLTNMTSENDPAVVNSAVRYVRLGYLTEFESGYTLTVGDRIGGNRRGAKLTPPYYRLLSSLDPTVDDRDFAAGEVGLLGWLAGEGLVALVRADASLADLTMIPVPRRDMAFVEDLDEGYLLQVVDGEPFAVSKIGAQFIPFVDGDRTLGEIAEILKGEILANPEEQGTVEQIEKDQGRSLDSFLVEEALVLIRDFAPSQAITFEPTA
jgi:hypothetical protein